MAAMSWFKALLLLGAVLAAVQQAEAHGSMTMPRARNVVAPINGETWWKDHGNGAGLCGDSFQGFTGEANYHLNRPGPSQATYTAGQTVNLQWWLQVNHGGRIGVKLCPRRDSLSQACFDQYPLFRSDFPSERFVHIMTGGQQFMSASFRLPAGVSCSGGCVLQWEYLTMNSCFEPCNRAVCGVYADLRNPVTGGYNMGSCCGGPACTTSVGEMFRNCADITILGGSGGPPPATPPPASPPPASPPPAKPPTTCTRFAAGGGACGGSTCCPSGQCCSKWGWCGISSDHCGSGCQRGYGSCWASAARLARAARRSSGNTNTTASVADATTASGAAPIPSVDSAAVSITNAISSGATAAPAASADEATAAAAAAAVVAAPAATEPVLPAAVDSTASTAPAAASETIASAAAAVAPTQEPAGGNSTAVPASAPAEPVVQEEQAATATPAETGAAAVPAAAGNRRLLRM